MDKKTKMPHGRYAQLTLDFPFKKVFASEEDKDLLIALLNAFLERKLAHPIMDVAIQNPYIQGQTKANRDAHLDIRCRDSAGNRFIVEMQTGRQRYFVKRAVYYSSVAISGSGKKGDDWDFDFPNVYSLNFLDYDLDFGEGNGNVVQYVSLSNEDFPHIRYDCENLVFVRLTEFRKGIEDCHSLQDKLIFSLRNAHNLKERPEQLSESFFGKLFNIAEISNFTVEEYSEYEASLMTRWDYSASIKYAKEEGEAIGEARGVAIGEARGRIEVLDLLAKGYSIEQIKETLKAM